MEVQIKRLEGLWSDENKIQIENVTHIQTVNGKLLVEYEVFDDLCKRREDIYQLNEIEFSIWR